MDQADLADTAAPQELLRQHICELHGRNAGGVEDQRESAHGAALRLSHGSTNEVIDYSPKTKIPKFVKYEGVFVQSGRQPIRVRKIEAKYCPF